MSSTVQLSRGSTTLDADSIGCDADADTECTPMLQFVDDRDADVASAEALDDPDSVSLMCDEQTSLIEDSKSSMSSTSHGQHVSHSFLADADADAFPAFVRNRTLAGSRSEFSRRRRHANNSSVERRFPPSWSSLLSSRSVAPSGKRSEDSAFYDDDSCVECTCGQPPPINYVPHCHCACSDVGQSGDFRGCSGGRLATAASDVDDDEDDDDDNSDCSCCCECNRDSSNGDQCFADPPLNSNVDVPVAVTNLSSLAPMSLLSSTGQRCGQSGSCSDSYDVLRRCMMSSIVALQSASKKSTSSPPSSSIISLCRSKSFNSRPVASVSSTVDRRKSGGLGPEGGRFKFRRCGSSPSLPTPSPPCTCGLGVNGGFVPGHQLDMNSDVGQQVFIIIIEQREWEPSR